MPFWKMIKEGYDHFEVTKQEPKVDFCEKKYVFDAVKAPNATRDPVFDASAKCPAYVIPDEVANAVREKQATDLAETARLIAKGTPVARINTGIDGGMHRVFAARVPEGNTGLSEPGDGSLSLMARAPGTIPSHVNPPRAPGESRTPSENLLTGAPEQPKLVAAPAPAPAQVPTRVANAAPAEQNDGFFSSLARKVGLGGAADATASTPPSKPKAAEAKRSEPPRPETPKATAPKPADAKSADTKPADAKPVDTKPADTKHAAAARPPLKPSVDTPAPAAKDNQVSGSAPIVSSNSFDSRFGAAK
jgi:hypothetical protein